ncbi:MAG: shufflon system plasmid conjugative transfer pilus tip adhesin PilV [Alphaproteobacteria bacterium]|nr:shufflon system plasmid conjugative transfer pilus tip adhesin PilV [Alphaproteobacteria bacterium]
MMKLVKLLFQKCPHLKQSKENKASEQSGSLMIEAIALLGLMSIMSPMVVRQTSDRTTEMEDAVLAGQMKTLKDALKNYLEVNYETITSSAGATSWAGGTSGEVSIGDIIPFLPASFLSADNKLRGNRFLDDNGYKFGYHGDCTKTIQKDGSSYTYGSGTACTSPGGATECKCMNWNLTGLVLSDNNSEIPDKRISRIAQMIGSDGGFAPTANYREGFGIDNNSIVGSQGMWQIDQVANFGLSGATKGGQLAAITGYAGGTQGDYLYRRKVNGIPDANSMFTDLDMGGNGQCDETSADGQCSRIHSAGGVEVVDGRLIVRQKHVDVGNWNEEADATNDHIISLGLKNAIMAVNDTVDIAAANTAGLQLDANGASLMMLNNETGLFVNNDGIVLNYNASTASIVSLDDNGITAGTDKNFTVEADDSVIVKGGTGTQLQMGHDSINMNSNNTIFINTPEAILAMTNNAVDLYGNANVTVRSTNEIGVYAGNRVNISAGNTSAFAGSGIIVDQNGWLNYGTSGPSFASNTAFAKAHTQIVGGLIVNTSGNHALLFTQNADGVKPPVVISDKGIAVHQSTDVPTGQAAYDIGNSKTDITITAKGAIGGRIMLAKGTPDAPQIEMRGDTGLIFASQFIPRFAVDMSSVYMDGHYSDNRGFGNTTDVNAQLSPIVQSQKRFKFNSATGMSEGIDSSSINSNSETFDINITMSNSGYKAHGGATDRSDASNLRFKVDPGFESVMNDIRLTSRGGARLSEILPNYIIKGIYELSNTYYKGPWPCVSETFSDPYPADGSAHCTFSLKNPTDLPNMEKPYSCDDFSASDRSSGVCSMDGDKMTINLYNGKYLECSGDDCDRIAHPFLGVVPAPGRGITPDSDGYIDGMGTMTGYDEGPCPDGYTPNIIFTPARFEVGKVLHAISRYDYTEPMMVGGEEVGEEAWIAKNYDKNRWNRNDTGIDGDYASSTEGLFQPGTQMEYATKAIKKSDGTILGWQVAMGTYSQVGDDFVWNYGATTRVGDMFGYATTYCTFNPQRYRMPNMKWLNSDDGSGNKVIAPMRGAGDNGS